MMVISYKHCKSVYSYKDFDVTWRWGEEQTNTLIFMCLALKKKSFQKPWFILYQPGQI